MASVVGFGIGSLLTPALALETGIKLAVAAISIPHAIGTGIPLWTLRAHVNREVLLQFGIANAIGGLAGALLHAWAGGAVLTAVFGLLLLSAGLAELVGWAKRVRLQGAPAIAAGGASGLLGGMVGNQGGIRSAALLEFNLPRDSFIATATAIALIVGAARMPVYLYTEGRQLLDIWPIIAWTTGGVVIGTLLGRRFLSRIPETVFRRIVGAFVLLLGLYMLYRATALALGQ